MDHRGVDGSFGSSVHPWKTAKLMPASMLKTLLPIWVEAKDSSLLDRQFSILTTVKPPHSPHFVPLILERIKHGVRLRAQTPHSGRIIL